MKEAIHQQPLVIFPFIEYFQPLRGRRPGVCCHICGFVPLLVVGLNITLHDS